MPTQLLVPHACDQQGGVSRVPHFCPYASTHWIVPGVDNHPILALPFQQQPPSGTTALLVAPHPSAVVVSGPSRLFPSPQSLRLPPVPAVEMHASGTLQSGEYAKVRVLGLLPGFADVEVQHGTFLSPSRALVALPCAAAVAEVRQLELCTSGIECLDDLLRDMGLVVQVRGRARGPWHVWRGKAPGIWLCDIGMVLWARDRVGKGPSTGVCTTWTWWCRGKGEESLACALPQQGQQARRLWHCLSVATYSGTAVSCVAQPVRALVCTVCSYRAVACWVHSIPPGRPNASHASPAPCLLPLQWLQRHELQAEGQGCPHYTRTLLAIIATKARRLVAAATARGWIATVKVTDFCCGHCWAEALCFSPALWAHTAALAHLAVPLDFPECAFLLLARLPTRLPACRCCSQP